MAEGRRTEGPAAPSPLHYRLYFLNRDGRFCDVKEQEHLDDSSALKAARDLLIEFPAAEIWQGARLVGRVSLPLPPSGGDADGPS